MALRDHVRNGETNCAWSRIGAAGFARDRPPFLRRRFGPPRSSNDNQRHVVDEGPADELDCLRRVLAPELRKRVDFTDPYYRAPARFVSRRDAVMPEVRPEYLEGKKVGAIAGSSHEAYLKAMFTDAELHSYSNDDALRLALRRGEVDLIFGDAISLAFWINGTDSGECCAFSGGPFVESRYFGEGIGIAVRKGNDLLRQALNWALFRLWEKGRYTDLWLRYFSVSPF